MSNNDIGATLKSAQAQGSLATLSCYIKHSGPGFLQSAITLGGGSLAGALFLGVIGGYELLWVQLVAMILGVVMLSAIAYVTLSTESSPFLGIRRHVNPVLAWGWLAASLMANMVWVLPQYSLAYSALTDNLLPGTIPNSESPYTQLIVAVIMLGIATGITSCYGRKGKGIVLYERILKTLVAVIVLCFMGVVVKLGFSGALPWGKIFSGFIPNPALYFEPTEAYQSILATIENSNVRAWWSEQIVGAQRSRMIAAASAAVGINMTFLLPYSLLAKKWNRDCRGLAIFDLCSGMVIPFVLATSCIVIASASLFNGKPYEGLLVEKQGVLMVDESNQSLAPQIAAWKKSIDSRQASLQAPLEKAEKSLAAMLIKRDNKDFAGSLSLLVGKDAARLLFGLGVLAMTLSTISLLMIISGFCICEAFQKPHGGSFHKWGTLCASTGIIWPFIWNGTSKAYLAITTSVFGYILLPIAFLTFFVMMNSKKLLGEHRPKGGKRWVWNSLMGLSLLTTGLAAGNTAWGKTMTIAGESIYVGRWFILIFSVAIIIGFIYNQKVTSKES
ncbi:MAG: divalent metal cation transporter [Planctomycetes bacterium]|nr:divalent metal cation transporter [Planctomycetota bacterium]